MPEVLFIQGGSAGAYEADANLVASLRKHLGRGYKVRYPEMPNEDEPDYATWSEEIARELAEMQPRPIVVGHSIGGSVLIKWLVEGKNRPPLGPVFLVSLPFWHDHPFWKWPEAQLPSDAGDRLPPDLELFIYHGGADDFVPPEHAERHAKLLPRARLHILPGRDHQLNDDLREIADQIRSLAPPAAPPRSAAS
jgi:predicted alpha/beta hydrolase family esterase